MHGAQGPGGSEGGIAPRSTGPRTSGRGVYARRRILAIVVVLLLLALLAPRACQALMGSNNDPGPGSSNQQAGAVGADSETGAEDGADEADTGDPDEANTSPDDAGNDDAKDTDAADKDEETGSEDDSSDRGAPFVDDGPDAENGDEEAAPDLVALAVPLAVEEDGTSTTGDGTDDGAGTPSSSEAAPAPAGQQPAGPENMMVARRSAAEQPASDGQDDPTGGSGPASGPGPNANTTASAPDVEPPAITRGERIRDRRAEIAAAPLAEPAALGGGGGRRNSLQPAVVDPAVVEPAVVEPAAPVVAAPAAPAPVAPVAQTPAVPTGGFNGAGAVPQAVAVGPRVAAAGPARMPGAGAF
jgi:hypothetical protein